MSSNSSQPSWLVIVNPNAGNGKGKKDWDMISSALKSKGIDFDFRFTAGKDDATLFTAGAIEKGYRKIITAGGDGTLNEVLNGVFRSGTDKAADITLALIPVGTGNDWARQFGIPSDYNKAADLIREEKFILQDVGVLDYSDGEQKKRRHFINTAGFGFESAVVKRTNYQKDKGRGGKLVYLYNLVASLLTYRNSIMEIEIDGTKIREKVFSVNVGNGKYCGGGMRQTPDADPTDGLLDVSVIMDMSKFEVIRNINILYDGTILKHPLVKGFRCKNIRVSSESVIYTEADGEYLGHTPAEFSILPSAIRIVYGTGLSQ